MASVNIRGILHTRGNIHFVSNIQDVIDDVLSLLNVQKLSLPANTPVGTQVSVTDGFVISGSIDASDGSDPNGLYVASGSSNGKTKYIQAVGIHYVEWQGSLWILFNPNTEVDAESSEHVAEPWLVASWDNFGITPPTLTHPAIQQLAAPSSAQGGIFVSGGTQDGVYALGPGGFGGSSSKQIFTPLGDNDTHIYWDDDASRWYFVFQGGDPVYYSLSDVASPDLATGWKNASDDSPASITVTSLTVGQIAAGLKVGSTFYATTTTTNGRNGYHDVAGVAADYTFDGTKWSDGTTNGSGNTAFPWDGGIGERDDICSETNWQPTP